MKQPTFPEGAGVALAASLAGGALFATLGSLLPGSSVLRLLVAAAGFAYLCYLLSRSTERVGRITILAFWLVLAVVLWLWHPPLPLYLVLHTGAVWLVRALYFHSGALTALADLGLNGLALAAGIWAVTRTGSVFLGFWCFFLVQALFVFIPKHLRQRPDSTPAAHQDDDRFQHAYRAAQYAVRKLSSTH